MTRYFFHICSRAERIEDREGAAFATPQEALAEAILAAREILAEDVRKGQVDITRLLEIVDEEGKLVARMPLSDALN